MQHESSEELLDFDIWSSVRVALRKDTIHAEIFVTPSGVTPLRPFGCRQVKATCRLLLADHSALFHSLARLLSAGCSWDTLTRSSYPLASGLSHFPVSCLSRLSSPWRAPWSTTSLNGLFPGHFSHFLPPSRFCTAASPATATLSRTSTQHPPSNTNILIARLEDILIDTPLSPPHLHSLKLSAFLPSTSKASWRT